MIAPNDNKPQRGERKVVMGLTITIHPINRTARPILKTGFLVATAAVNIWQKAEDNEELSVIRILWASSCLQRHMRGDWGDTCEADKKLNDEDLKNGNRILSAYIIPEKIRGDAPDDKLWIITEADRSSTTILFPSDY